MYCFIVEGWNDDKRLRDVYPEIDTIVLLGNKFNSKARKKIEMKQAQGKEVLILVDPDEAGDIVANRFQQFYGLNRINVDPEKSRIMRIHGWKYGVEYCSDEYVRELLGGYGIDSN